jgi:hypothetical protein
MFLPGKEATYIGKPNGAVQSSKNNLRVKPQTPRLLTKPKIHMEEKHYITDTITNILFEEK